MPQALQSVVIHGHFYQPPREDPWLDEVEVEASAAPYHDWNERIERECYRTVVAAHLTAGGTDNRIVGIVNTLEWISFNYGATLLEWLEEHAKSTYDSILLADRASVDRLGFGNAIAQPYHHVILPLASRRDKRTEVLWGIADFRRRFGREPLGMWLPETAMDHETLDVLAECGIQFTILAPHQVVSAPPNGLPGEYRAANGRSVALFMYDGDLSHGVAFGGLLNNAEKWAAKMLRPRARTGDASGSGRLVSIATDGETYGHHHKFGEMALARVITNLNAKKGVIVENFASFLSRNPPAHEVKLVEPTSWSCPHGVERWRSNDGCRINGAAYPSQAWRTPLRAGLDVLAAGLHAQFASEGREYFEDPWAARDKYGEAVAAPAVEREQLVQHLAPSTQHQVRARELLEMERDALRMFSSCAWFFDDIGGLEPRQVLKYAAHACDLAAGGDPSLRPHLEKALLGYLASAESNEATIGTGRDIYERSVRPHINTEARVAAGVAAANALGLDTNAATPRAYTARLDQDDHVTLRVDRTGRETQLYAETKAISADSVDSGVRVSRPGVAGSELVHVNDLPERARRLVRATLRHQLLASSLTTPELASLANGDTTLRELVGRALVRSLEELPVDQSGVALRRANAVLDLLEQLESTIPFDAQAVWWRVRPRVRDRATQLAALGARLGFDVTALAVGDGATGQIAN